MRMLWRLSAAAAMTAAGLAGCSRGEPEGATAAEAAPGVIAETGTAAPEAAPPDIPDTDIFVAPLAFEGGAPAVGAFANTSNHPGYDNQPSFLPGEAAFYYVAASENGKTDIWLHDIARGANIPVFSSPDVSEYSPKRAPDGKHLSYIQENEAGDVTQVHQRRLGAPEEGAAVIDFAPLGYYAWLDGGKSLGVYYRSEPGSLYRVDVASGAERKLHAPIGRALQADKAGAHLWFTEAPEDAPVEAPAPNPFRLMRYDAAASATAPLFHLPVGAQDFAVIFDEAGAALGFFSAAETTLYYRALAADADPGADLSTGVGGWTRVADLSAAGLANATRIAVSDDHKWIAVVGEAAE